MADALTSFAEQERNTEKRRLERVTSILQARGDTPTILINRDEIILDLNSSATELFLFQKADIEGKKIDEIIFLEERDHTSHADSEGEGYQRAKAERKDGSQFSIKVELEMADREFGIITVTLHPEPDGTSSSEAPLFTEPPPSRFHFQLQQPSYQSQILLPNLLQKRFPNVRVRCHPRPAPKTSSMPFPSSQLAPSNQWATDRWIPSPSRCFPLNSPSHFSPSLSLHSSLPPMKKPFRTSRNTP
jgi:PAS domain S-box-containing protein